MMRSVYLTAKYGHIQKKFQFLSIVQRTITLLLLIPITAVPLLWPLSFEKLPVLLLLCLLLFLFQTERRVSHTDCLQLQSSESNSISWAYIGWGRWNHFVWIVGSKLARGRAWWPGLSFSSQARARTWLSLSGTSEPQSPAWIFSYFHHLLVWTISSPDVILRPWVGRLVLSIVLMPHPHCVPALHLILDAAWKKGEISQGGWKHCSYAVFGLVWGSQCWAFEPPISTQMPRQATCRKARIWSSCWHHCPSEQKGRKRVFACFWTQLVYMVISYFGVCHQDWKTG